MHGTDLFRMSGNHSVVPDVECISVHPTNSPNESCTCTHQSDNAQRYANFLSMVLAVVPLDAIHFGFTSQLTCFRDVSLFRVGLAGRSALRYGGSNELATSVIP